MFLRALRMVCVWLACNLHGVSTLCLRRLCVLFCIGCVCMCVFYVCVARGLRIIFTHFSIQFYKLVIYFCICCVCDLCVFLYGSCIIFYFPHYIFVNLLCVCVFCICCVCVFCGFCVLFKYHVCVFSITRFTNFVCVCVCFLHLVCVICVCVA